MKLWVNKWLLFGIGFLLPINACMMGMHNSESKIEKLIPPIQTTNRSDKIDVMLEKMIDDLSSSNLDIETITVWDIQSTTKDIDLERIRQHIIMELVSNSKFQVVSRKRIKELLDEQNLALSGVLDVSNAVAIGELVGIDGFIDGYLSIEQYKIEIHLNLIDTKKGVLIWALNLHDTL